MPACADRGEKTDPPPSQSRGRGTFPIPLADPDPFPAQKGWGALCDLPTATKPEQKFLNKAKDFFQVPCMLQISIGSPRSQDSIQIPPRGGAGRSRRGAHVPNLPLPTFLGESRDTDLPPAPRHSCSFTRLSSHVVASAETNSSAPSKPAFSPCVSQAPLCGLTRSSVHNAELSSDNCILQVVLEYSRCFINFGERTHEVQSGCLGAWSCGAGTLRGLPPRSEGT